MIKVFLVSIFSTAVVMLPLWGWPQLRNGFITDWAVISGTAILAILLVLTGIYGHRTDFLSNSGGVIVAASIILLSRERIKTMLSGGYKMRDEYEEKRLDDRSYAWGFALALFGTLLWTFGHIYIDLLQGKQ